MSDQQILKIKKRAKDLRDMYANSPTKDTTSFLIYGGSGSAKTSLIRSCRTPILVHSFDPGGTEVLQGKVPYSPYDSCIENGKIMVDTRFEHEDPYNPKAYELWDKVFHDLKREKFFDHLGTFVMDSGTTFSQVIMWYVLSRANPPRTGGVPQQNDYMPQMVHVENALRDILTLPCDIVFICHNSTVKDDILGRVMKGPLLTGKLTMRIPLLFSEMYHAEAKEQSSNTNYSLLTRKTGSYEAKTRMGKGGELEQYEKPDIKMLLKKAGRNYQDKPDL